MLLILSVDMNLNPLILIRVSQTLLDNTVYDSKIAIDVYISQFEVTEYNGWARYLLY